MSVNCASKIASVFSQLQQQCLTTQWKYQKSGSLKLSLPRIELLHLPWFQVILWCLEYCPSSALHALFELDLSELYDYPNIVE